MADKVSCDQYVRIIAETEIRGAKHFINSVLMMDYSGVLSDKDVKKLKKAYRLLDKVCLKCAMGITLKGE